MDVKAKVDEINTRCETDEAFRKLLEENLPAALKQCGIDSPETFVEQVEASGIVLGEEDLEGVAGGCRGDGAPASVDPNYFRRAVGGWRRWASENDARELE